jgi:pyridinium-3,5-bisthiocarboxylic acid mononucleotide nickel chelatase
VIADTLHRQNLTTLLFNETSAIGLRLRREQRLTLPREMITVATPWGEVPAKKILTPAGVVVTPEYEACRAVAEAHQVPLQSVYAAINRLSPPLS